MQSLRRREISVAVCITLLILAIRMWFARKVNFCGTPDSCYALGLAQGLARYHAFHASFVFDLQLHHPQIPNTGIEYWRPGVSLLLYLLRALGGTTLQGSLVIASLAGVLWAAAAWFVAMRTTANAKIALASYTLCFLLSPGWDGSLTPDPTLFYAAAIAWFLALFTVRRQGLLQDVIALFCVSAAYTIRNDAGLLLVPLVVVLLYRWRGAGARKTSGEAPVPGSSAVYGVAMLAGFALALAPMHLLYRHVLGTAFPAGASQALYLNDLSDFSNYGVPVSLHTMLSHGVKHLVVMRVSAGAFIVYRVLALVLGYAALVFLPALAVRNGGQTAADPAMPEFAGPVAFGATVLVVYSLALPAVGVFSALRSSTALLPVVSVAVVIAILRITRTPRLAWVVTCTVIAIYLVSGVMDDRRSIGPMNSIGDADRAQAKALAAMGALPREGTIVMTPDPVQFSVTTGYPAIPMPGNGLQAITNEALDLHASHAILDGEHLPGSSAEVDQKLHPVQTRTVPGESVLLLELPAEFRQR
jgi:hypothetical protein